MTPIPQHIHRGEREVVLTWDDNHEGTFPARQLRLACQCAHCVDEMTGKPLLDPAAVPQDVAARSIGLVGNYAIRIDWSDGHATGIYTYELLAALCPCDRCKAERQGGRAEE